MYLLISLFTIDNTKSGVLERASHLSSFLHFPGSGPGKGSERVLAQPNPAH